MRVRHTALKIKISQPRYLNICRKITISDLQKNGTTYPWLKVAEKIGVDRFVAAVEVLSEFSDVLRVPSIEKINYLRVRKIIKALWAEQDSVSDLYNILLRDKIFVSKSFVFKVVAELKKKES